MTDIRDRIIVVTISSPGVAKGAGGWVIVGGKLKRVPPRGPAIAKLAAAAQALDLTDGVKGVDDFKAAAEKTFLAAAAEIAG